IVLDSGASILARGAEMTVLDLVEDAPGGNVQLVAQDGNVTISSGADINVAGVGNGFAGRLGIATSSDRTTTLNGTLEGGAAYKDTGGDFSLQTGSLAGSLPWTSGFTRSFSISLGQGDITVPAGIALDTGDVLLVANSGNVVV